MHDNWPMCFNRMIISLWYGSLMVFFFFFFITIITSLEYDRLIRLYRFFSIWFRLFRCSSLLRSSFWCFFFFSRLCGFFLFCIHRFARNSSIECKGAKRRNKMGNLFKWNLHSCTLECCMWIKRVSVDVAYFLSFFFFSSFFVVVVECNWYILCCDQEVWIWYSCYQISMEFLQKRKRN